MPLPTPRLFGTDGIRGPFGESPLDQATVTRLGFHLAEHLTKQADRAPRIVLGGDTRESTVDLATWLVAGFRAGGGGGHYAGVIPTPGVAYLTRTMGLDGGVAISASHNPFPDNGIKLFDRDGFKWDLGEEHALESELLTDAEPEFEEDPATLDASASLGEQYLEHVRSSVTGDRPLAGLRIALDAANGAAAPYAQRLFEALGAETRVTGDQPDGRNINLECGSTHTAPLQGLVLAEHCDLGVAFDGDADRALLIDELGQLQDGDAMLYLWACKLQDRGDLVPSAIVATTMSNLGLELALRRRGIEIVRCDVGDRVVVQTMRRDGIRLGGEQSGHLVDLELSSTGDGLMTAIQMARLVADDGRPLSAIAGDLDRLPQILLNVQVTRKTDFTKLPGVMETARSIEEHLGSEGRLLLRYSGTEPLARVMIEGRDQAEIENLAHDLANAIEKELGTE